MAFSFTERVTPTRTKDERFVTDVDTPIAHQTLARALSEEKQT